MRILTEEEKKQIIIDFELTKEEAKELKELDTLEEINDYLQEIY